MGILLQTWAGDDGGLAMRDWLIIQYLKCPGSGFHVYIALHLFSSLEVERTGDIFSQSSQLDEAYSSP